MRPARKRECVRGTRLASPSKFTAEEHRERARQCLCIAQLEMAQVWVNLAHALEGPVDKSENGTDTSRTCRVGGGLQREPIQSAALLILGSRRIITTA